MTMTYIPRSDLAGKGGQVPEILGHRRNPLAFYRNPQGARQPALGGHHRICPPEGDTSEGMGH